MKSRLLLFALFCIACTSPEGFAWAKGPAIQYVPVQGESYGAARTRLIEIDREPIPAPCDSHHICWGPVISGAPGGGRRDASETQLAELELIHKDIDHSNGIVFVDVVIQPFGKQHALRPIHPFDESLHATLRLGMTLGSVRSLTGCFHTAWTRSGR